MLSKKLLRTIFAPLFKKAFIKRAGFECNTGGYHKSFCDSGF